MVRVVPEIKTESQEFWKRLGNVKHITFIYLCICISVAFFIGLKIACIIIIVTFQISYFLVTYYKGFLFVNALLTSKKNIDNNYLLLKHYPSFNILLANYKEKGDTIRDLIKNIDKINYPKELIMAFLIIQEDDSTTLQEIANIKLPHFVELLLIHPVRQGEVQSKSRALNCGLKKCKNDLITVFDSEDEPDEDQFLKVAYHFANNDVDVVQCSIGIYNSNQNFIARFFAAEFRCFFEYLLNGIDKIGNSNFSPYLPLGGTSFYAKREIVKKVGVFDMFNPTEDLIFSSSVYKMGGRIGHLQSITKGEAPVKFKQLLTQRTRWVKGFIISTCVINRNIVKSCKEMGVIKWLTFNLWTMGSIIGLGAPIFVAVTIAWVIFQSSFFTTMFPYWLWLFGFGGLMVTGTIVSILIFALPSFHHKRYKDLLLSPLFIIFSNIILVAASYKAIYQLITNPNMAWAKTEHGLAKKDGKE